LSAGLACFAALAALVRCIEPPAARKGGER
jgi:hypothetical protein